MRWECVPHPQRAHRGREQNPAGREPCIGESIDKATLERVSGGDSGRSDTGILGALHWGATWAADGFSRGLHCVPGDQDATDTRVHPINALRGAVDEGVVGLHLGYDRDYYSK